MTFRSFRLHRLLSAYIVLFFSEWLPVSMLGLGLGLGSGLGLGIFVRVRVRDRVRIRVRDRFIC